MALHGAHEVDLLHGRVADVERARVAVGLGVGDVLRGVEARADLVRARAQELLHVEVVALEAVAGLADLLSVHVDVREAVDVLETQPHGLLRREGGGHVERAREVPLRAARPLGELLVLRPVRVGDELRLVERGVDAAGHRHGTRHRVRLRLRERPGAREVDLRRARRERRRQHRRRDNHLQYFHLYMSFPRPLAGCGKYTINAALLGRASCPQLGWRASCPQLEASRPLRAPHLHCENRSDLFSQGPLGVRGREANVLQAHQKPPCSPCVTSPLFAIA